MSLLVFELPKVEVNTYRKSNPLEAKVLENIRFFSDIDPENDARHIVFKVKNLSFREGQSIGVLSPGENSAGKPHAVRLYSIASVGNDVGHDDHLELCVKRVVYLDTETNEKKFGIASNYLCDLKKNDIVLFTGPAGRNFLLPIQSQIHRDYLFFATGTGIAPFKGMLKRLFTFTENFNHDVYLFYGVKKADELMYNDEFEEYKKFKNFHYITALSREQKADTGERIYVHHRIYEYKEKLIRILQDPNSLVYICGIKGMEEKIKQQLASILNLKEDDEYFMEKMSGRILLEVY